MCFLRGLPRFAGIYVGLITVVGIAVLGIAVLGFSLFVIAKKGELDWVYLAGLTALCSFFSVRIPSKEGRYQGLGLSAL